MDYQCKSNDYDAKVHLKPHRGTNKHDTGIKYHCTHGYKHHKVGSHHH